VVFAGDEVGIYSGAGFMVPRGNAGSSRMGGSIKQATLRMSDQSAGFSDLLNAALLRGSVIAQRSDAEVQPTLREVAQRIRERLGRARLVMAE